eukprot:GHVQ01003400.1.p1 GENE.GHVQ01003400.1~~GHVQ01003400.1.p1  ORF type:complete len:213 (+),score=50.96 GHVQ01003400.1:66-704(+)
MCVYVCIHLTHRQRKLNAVEGWEQSVRAVSAYLGRHASRIEGMLQRSFLIDLLVTGEDEPHHYANLLDHTTREQSTPVSIPVVSSCDTPQVTLAPTVTTDTSMSHHTNPACVINTTEPHPAKVTHRTTKGKKQQSGKMRKTIGVTNESKKKDSRQTLVVGGEEGADKKMYRLKDGGRRAVRRAVKGEEVGRSGGGTIGEAGGLKRRQVVRQN